MIFEKSSTNLRDIERITIAGTTANIDRVSANEIWKHSEFNITKDLGHKTVKDFIKHLKCFDFKLID